MGVSKTALRTSQFPKGYLLYAQHIGNDLHTLPNNASTTSYTLSRRPVPASTYEANDYETVNLTASFGGSGNTTLLIDRRFYMVEQFPNVYYLAGIAHCSARVGAKGDGTYATNITNVKLSLETVNANGTYVALTDTKNISFSTPFSVSSTSWSTIDVYAMLGINPTTMPTDVDLVYHLKVYGNAATSTPSGNSVRLYYTRGSSDTYVELSMEEQ